MGARRSKPKILVHAVVVIPRLDGGPYQARDLDIVAEDIASAEDQLVSAKRFLARHRRILADGIKSGVRTK